MNKVQYKMDTSIFDMTIVQTVQDPFGNLTRRVIDTQEREMRMALIKLGWTPPKNDI